MTELKINEALKDYVEFKKSVLRNFRVLRYCTEEEIKELACARSEIHADRICRKIIDKYLDLAYEDEKKLKTSDSEILGINVRELYFLSTRTRNALLRNRFETIADFLDEVKDGGWYNMKGMGDKCVDEIYSAVYPGRERTEILKMVRLTKQEPSRKR